MSSFCNDTRTKVEAFSSKMLIDPNLTHKSFDLCFWKFKNVKYAAVVPNFFVKERITNFYSILFYSITLEGCWGTTDEFATIPFHLVLFSAALVEMAKSIPVHSLILSSHLFFCLPLFLFPFSPVGLSLLNQKTLRHGQTILAFVSWPGSGVRHILHWLLGSFCEPPHW